jgi:hypothetical protein
MTERCDVMLRSPLPMIKAKIRGRGLRTTEPGRLYWHMQALQMVAYAHIVNVSVRSGWQP